MKTSEKKRRTSMPQRKVKQHSYSSSKPVFPSPTSLTIVYETDQFVVVDKPALFDSQNSRDDRASVVQFLEKKFGFAGLVHRLDFGTSGLMVCAKNSQSAKTLTEAMMKGEICRAYLALTFGRIEQNILTAANGITAVNANHTHLIKATHKLEGTVEDKNASLFFKIKQIFKNSSLIEVELETGRKHQIRVQFSELNHPLLGDHLYRKKGSDKLFERPALHAFKLKVFGQVFESPPPSDLQALIEKHRGL